MYNTIQNDVQNLKQLAQDYHLTAASEQCDYLLADITQDAYSFVVVGEFSTGKSTFINGFLGQPLLPTGITPTTSTINVLQYGEPKVIIHYLDGHKEYEKNIDVLNQFIATKLDDVESINYIDVFQPTEFFQNRVLLIDTPGLNDVNELRSDITYQYIPRADVIFFLLDCRTPLRQSEFEFLTETLVGHNLERIIFIANFADEVDEDELSFIVTKIKSALAKSLPSKEIIVIPYSAAEVVEAKATQDEALLDISGYNELQTHIQNLCDEGIRKEEKLHRFQQRTRIIQKEIELAFSQKQQLNTQSTEELVFELKKIESWKKGQSEILNALTSYYDERLFEFEKMASKSVSTFFEQLEEDTMEEIRLFQGSNFEHYFQEVLPSKINKSMKAWIEKYSPQLQMLIGKLETALNDILSKYLDENVYTQKTYATPLQKTSGIDFEMEKQTDPLIASGLIVGGTSALFLILGGPILLPIIGMVGLPYLQKKMLASQLEKIKPQVMSELQMKLMLVLHEFEQEVLHYLQSNCQQVYNACVELYERRIEQQYQLIKVRIDELKQNVATNQTENERIEQRLKTLLQIEK